MEHSGDSESPLTGGSLRRRAGVLSLPGAAADASEMPASGAAEALLAGLLPRRRVPRGVLGVCVAGQHGHHVSGAVRAARLRRGS